MAGRFAASQLGQKIGECQALARDLRAGALLPNRLDACCWGVSGWQWLSFGGGFHLNISETSILLKTMFHFSLVGFKGNLSLLFFSQGAEANGRTGRCFFPNSKQSCGVRILGLQGLEGGP